MKVFDDEKQGGEKIITEYKVLACDGETTKVQVILHTGRTHQIRAHFAHIGKPIVGDMKYGDERKNKARGVARQALVSKSLSFSFSGILAYLNDKEFTSQFEV